MDEIKQLGPSLPVYALAPTVILCMIIVILVAWRLPSNRARFLTLALALRPLLSSMHEITFSASPLGVSWNALGSIVVVFGGMLLIRRRKLIDLTLLPIYIISLVAAVSGLVNQQTGPTASVLIKYGYLASIMMLTADAARDVGASRLSKTLIWPMCIPLFFQLVSLATGTVKAGESDGSAGYIGGFYHEAAFSILLAGTLMVVSLTDGLRVRVSLLLMAWALAGILLANYRTAILAVLPIVGVTVLVNIVRRFIPEQRIFITGVMMIFVLTIGLTGAAAESERFADLSVVFTQGADLIKEPAQYSQLDRRILSGRPVIWSEYIYAWKGGSPINHLFGFGPESWVGNFEVYAHNTLISALYETGILGVIATIVLWLWYFILACLVAGGARWKLVAAHLSFIVLNMATMPMWMIEGIIFYGVLCGFTINQYRLKVLRTPKITFREDKDRSVKIGPV